jgi:signal peptidase I
MSKRKPRSKRAHQTTKSRGTGPDRGNRKDRPRAAEARPAHKHVPSPAAIRETIESVVVAFVLAFLFRTFEAEAFVIPTGSMAPTLMGRHKDLECPECGYPYQISASDEVDPNTNVAKPAWARVVGSTCPMCRYPLDMRSEVADELGDELTEEMRTTLSEALDLPPEVATELAEKIKKKSEREIQGELVNELGISYGLGANVAEKLVERRDQIVAKRLQKKYPSFKGDRILVGKFCYQFADPERWEVAVFKYPGEAKTNFIKRLVGLPGETIRIFHGDIFVRKNDDDFTIARKERPEKLLAMLQPVYDNDYVLPKIIEAGWPARWQSWNAAGSGAQGAWVTSKDYRWFETDGRAAGETWIRYQHFVPPPYQWRYLENGRLAPDGPPQRQLISDFCAYNTGRHANGLMPDFDNTGLHWVGDLAVQCTLEVLEAPSESSQAIFELVEGGWRMQCRIDLATGKARLAIDHENPARHTAKTIDGKDYRPSAQTAVRGVGRHEVIFANCDDQLRLWVDGKAVEFDTTTCYQPLGNQRPRNGSFANDLAPVGVGAQGAAVRITHLKVLRDIYYIADKVSQPVLTDFEDLLSAYDVRSYHDLTANIVARFFSEPRMWDAFDRMQWAEFRLEKDPARPEEDQFLALGDNSPKSKDGRLWEVEHYVERRLLIGKALYIYWPHSWNEVPGTGIWFPMFPNVAKMGFVR